MVLREPRSTVILVMVPTTFGWTCGQELKCLDLWPKSKWPKCAIWVQSKNIFAGKSGEVTSVQYLRYSTLEYVRSYTAKTIIAWPQ